jgi:hypothetical protein
MIRFKKNNDMNKATLEISLINEVTGDNLKELLIEGTEVTLDNFLAEGVFKEIPFFGMLYKSARAVFGLRESIFAKKIFKFLIELENVPKAKRIEFIDKLEQSKEYRQKVGEKLIILIDQLDDIEKPQIIGKLLKAAINESISYEDFLRLSLIVQKAFLPDLVKLKTYPRVYEITRIVEEQFVAIGIYSMALRDNEIGRRHASMSNSNINAQLKVPPILRYEINELGKALIEYGLK